MLLFWSVQCISCVVCISSSVVGNISLDVQYISVVCNESPRGLVCS